MKRKKSRPLNGYQKWMKETYEELIFFIIRSYPGLNATEILEKIPEIRNEWFNLEGHDDKTKELEYKFPKGKPSRKTIHAHLNDMLNSGRIELVSGGYIATSERISKIAPEFDKQVHKLLSEDFQDRWYPTHAGEVAASYISSDPKYSHTNYQDLLNIQSKKFTYSLFWIEDILEECIIKGNLPINTYSKKTKKINLKTLVDGLNNFFGNSQLFTFTIAIRPQKLQDFLISKIGKALLTDILERKWNTIVERGIAERKKIETLKKKRSK